jgi:hypothetical protein
MLNQRPCNLLLPGLEALKRLCGKGSAMVASNGDMLQVRKRSQMLAKKEDKVA